MRIQLRRLPSYDSHWTITASLPWRTVVPSVTSCPHLASQIECVPNLRSTSSRSPMSVREMRMKAETGLQHTHHISLSSPARLLPHIKTPACPGLLFFFPPSPLTRRVRARTPAVHPSRAPPSPALQHPAPCSPLKKARPTCQHAFPPPLSPSRPLSSLSLLT